MTQHQAPEVTSEDDVSLEMPALKAAGHRTRATQPAEVVSELLGCPLCNRPPKRNGRLGGAGGVICRHAHHLVQVYGASQADADKNWNTRATQPLSLTVDEILVVARLRGLLAKATPLPWVRANLANITTKFTQVAPNITSQHTAYRSTDDVLCTEAVNALPTLLDRLQSLSLPVDIDRSGLAQEVDDISYAGVGP